MHKKKIASPNFLHKERSTYKTKQIIKKQYHFKTVTTALVITLIVVGFVDHVRVRAQEQVQQDATQQQNTQIAQNTDTTTQKIYIKEVNTSPHFLYDENSVTVEDNYLKCTKDDRVLQWQKGRNRWECKLPSKTVFGTVNKGGLKVSSAGKIQCENDNEMLYWNAKKDYWSCGNAGSTITMTDIDGVEISQNPTSGDIMYFDGTNWINKPIPDVVNGNFFAQNGNTFGDNAQLGTNDNYALLLKTNGAERVRITEDGSVGIGTTTPNAKLDVNGKFVASDNNYDVSATVHGAVFSYVNSDVQWSKDINSGLFVRSWPDASQWVESEHLSQAFGTSALVDDQLGVNTLDEQRGMSVYHGSYFGAQSGSVITDSYGIMVNPYQRGATVITNMYDLFLGSGYSDGTGSITNHFAIYQQDPQSTNYLAGNVGIGTNSPQASLDVGPSEISSGTGVITIDSSGRVTGTGTHFLSELTTQTTILKVVDDLGTEREFGIRKIISNTELYISTATSVIVTDKSFEYYNISIYAGDRIKSIGGFTHQPEYGKHAGYAGVAHSDTPWMGTYVSGQRYRGTNEDPMAVHHGDVVTALDAMAYDGNSLDRLAQITLRVADSDFTNGVPGEMLFNTRDTSGILASRMTINEEGNIGIGTLTPEVQLNVIGQVQVGLSADPFYTALGQNSLHFNRNTQFSYIDQYGIGGALMLRTSHASELDTNAMAILSNGRVGIGTDNPSSLLHIKANSSPLPAPYEPKSAEIILEATTSSGAWGLRALDTDALVSGQDINRFSIINKNSGDESFVIEHSGHVGIGTNNPEYKMQINSLENGDDVQFRFNDVQGGAGVMSNDRISGWNSRIYSNNASHYPYFATHRSRGSYDAETEPLDGDILGIFGGTAFDGSDLSQAFQMRAIATNDWSSETDTDLAFLISNESEFAERMRITSDGNVGIGTDNPETLAHVKSAWLSSGGFGIPNSAGIIIESTGSKWELRASADASTFPDFDPERFTIINKVNGVENFVIERAGDVGIGTIAPSERLTVYNGSTTGTYTTSGWAHSSDERLKTNVEPIENSLAKILSLESIYFNWKTNPNNDKQIGFIAQNVQKIIPEIVVGNEKNGYGISYGNMSALLTSAVQEQNVTITSNTLKTDANISTLTQLQDSIDTQLATVAQLLGSTLSEDGTIQQDVLQMQKDANEQSNLIVSIESKIGKLQSDVDVIDELQQSMTSILLALDEDKLIYTDDEGDLTLAGVMNATKIVADDIETDALTTGQFAVMEDEDSQHIGSVIIKKGTLEIPIQTTDVRANSHVFVTVKDADRSIFAHVENIIDGESFVIGLNQKSNEDVQVDWWIVDVIKNDEIISTE